MEIALWQLPVVSFVSADQRINQQRSNPNQIKYNIGIPFFVHFLLLVGYVLEECNLEFADVVSRRTLLSTTKCS